MGLLDQANNPLNQLQAGALAGYKSYAAPAPQDILRAVSDLNQAIGAARAQGWVVEISLGVQDPAAMQAVTYREVRVKLHYED